MNHCGIFHGRAIANTTLALYLEQITNEQRSVTTKGVDNLSATCADETQAARIVEIPRQRSARSHSCTHLVPGDVRLFAWFPVVVDVRAEDVFALAELGLLLPPHVRVVAEVCVVLSHGEGHRHLHAICGVAEGRNDKSEMMFD